MNIQDYRYELSRGRKNSYGKRIYECPVFYMKIWIAYILKKVVHVKI